MIANEKPTYTNPIFEEMTDQAIEIHRFKLLREQLHYVYRNSIFYKKQFDLLNLTPNDIKSFADFNKLPIFLNKEIERESQRESRETVGHPFGMHLCASPDEVVFTGTTSGTTGEPTFTYTFTAEDLEFMNKHIAHMLDYGGVPKNERILFAHALGIYATTSIIDGIKQYGALPIDIDVRSGSQSILQYANLTRPKAIMTTPSLAEHLLVKNDELHLPKLSDLQLNALFTVGEVGIGIPEVKKKIEDGFGCRVYDYLGEVGFSCDSDEYHGVHVVGLELSNFPNELVDPVTKKQLEIVDGVIGEVIITEFKLKALPRIRYASGDIMQVFTKPCPGCGFKGKRVKVVGRADDMVIVKGVNVYPTAIKEVIATFTPKLTGEMRIVLNNPPPRIEAPLLLKLELQEENISEIETEKLAHAIKTELHEKLRFTPKIIWCKRGELEKSMTKTPVFEKIYEK